MTPLELADLRANRRALGNSEWTQARRELFRLLREVFGPGDPPSKQTLTGPDFMLLAGLTSFADWIGSNQYWFFFGGAQECRDLKVWFRARREVADHALDVLGWPVRSPLAYEPKPFYEVFNFPPRPLQQAVAEALAKVERPVVILVEAPMGEGKTEAAFFAHLELQRRFRHRGLYVALPTKATGNAMFGRLLKFLQAQSDGKRTIDLQLLHGAALLNDTFQTLRPSGIHDPEAGGEVRAAEWFTHKKRALLSEYGVGTVDQALLPILPVKHNFVRLWGLANRVIVFDEIHAYDAYTGTLLVHLLQWLMWLGSSVILLSATLPPSIRRRLAYIIDAEMPEREERYPRLSIFSLGDKVVQKHFDADVKRRRTLGLVGIGPELTDILAALERHLSLGGMGLALFNTVQRAQDLFRLFPDGETIRRDGVPVGKRLSDGTEVLLFHARFPADRRQKREDHVLETFGEKGERSGRKILIATQVAEQSLDLDFDLLITDLAPIDLILQRAGRLWRHTRSGRPIDKPILVVAGLAGDEPPRFGDPLWWNAVYREDVLLSTWSLLRTDRQSITLPDEIDTLVQEVYEEEVDVPEHLRKRMEQALIEGEGEAALKRGEANQAIIGTPDDASWNQSGRDPLFDDDEPGVHRTLMARTRLTEESLVAIPLLPGDGFRPKATPDSDRARGTVGVKSLFLTDPLFHRLHVLSKDRILRCGLHQPLSRHAH